MAATTTLELSSNALFNLCQRYHDYNFHTNQPPHALEVLSYEHSCDSSETVIGFLGRHKFLTLKVRRIDAEGGQHYEQMRFFTKAPPLELGSRMAYIEEMGVFKKEVCAYRELLPELDKIYPNVTPKCYYADERLLVFEHLADHGFRMAAGRDGILNYEHLHCALKSLAALHAASLVYEVRCGRRLNDLHPEAVKENGYPVVASASQQQHVRVLNFNNANRAFAELIKLLPKYHHNLDFVLCEFPKRMSAIFDLVQTSAKYRNVFNHGDLWANNIMFQYGKFGETPIECRLVDFQMSRYAPPVLDLMTLLTIPSTREFRKRHMSELLCDYYRFMTEFLKREQLDIELLLPRAEFEETVVEFRIAGLIESLLFSHLTDLPPALTLAATSTNDGFNEFFATKRADICVEAFKTDAIYRARLTDMLEDFIDNFVLTS